MSIFSGSGSTNPSQIWFGNTPIQGVWVGANKVWPSGPYSDAWLWLPFTDGKALFKNEGTVGSLGMDHLGGSITHEYDHAYFSATGRIRFYSPPSSTWEDGYTFSVWVKDMQPNTGWWPVFWRGPVSGPPNESYLGFNTGATTSSLEAYLKLGAGSHVSNATRTVPVSGWNHVAVVWRRVSSSTYSCTFYVNGLSSGTSSGGGYSSGNTFSNDQFVFGSQGWAGGADDYAVWDRPLSAAEVTEVYNQGRSWLPQITTTSLPNFPINEYVYFTFADDFSADSWSATGVPAGLSMSTSGILSGTPTTASSGTITVTATRTSTGHSATKSFSWAVTDLQPLPSTTLTASGVNKMSHSGWARPNLTWSRSSGSGAFETNGTFIMPRGEGYVRLNAGITTGTNARIVSNLKGTLMQTAFADRAIALTTNKTIFEQGERVHIELNGYSSTSSDSFTFRYGPS